MTTDPPLFDPGLSSSAAPDEHRELSATRRLDRYVAAKDGAR